MESPTVDLTAGITSGGILRALEIPNDKKFSLLQSGSNEVIHKPKPPSLRERSFLLRYVS
jgi:hypothetical protein